MPEFKDKIKVLEAAQNGGFKVEVIEYTSLDGGKDIATAQALFMARQANIRLKQVRIQISKSAAIIEPGALHFMKGHIEVEAKAGGTGGIGGLARGLATMMLSNETFFRPRYTGNGEIYLEPSFGHFLIYQLKQNESLIVDKGMFYCSEGTVGVSVAMQKNLSSGAMGGEGWFQTKVTGPGICVFASPVPSDEILCYQLSGEKLQVDGNFALMRTEGIKFSVQKSTKSLLGSAVSGEGWLQTFEGSGSVWIAPTQAIYDDITNVPDFRKLVKAEGSSNTKT